MALDAIRCCEWVFAHGQIEALPGFLHRQEAREDRVVAFGSHTAVVDSHIAGNAVRQQSLPAV
ncbi:MAG: hypothetical protein JOZ19_04155 [Rubrobacter sp.]|nr:hypothetical protein [Rubrobacter sp.]